MTLDVKLLASERLTDDPDGGGLMTSNEIVDGVVNNLWPDISRVDRTYSAVNLRKMFIKADTADTAIYSGLHVILLMPPQDTRVTVTLFSTKSWSDERKDAQSAVERYLDASVVTRMIPYDRQLVDQRTILVTQRPELDLPNIGEVYVIADLPNETAPFFFRIESIVHSVQLFTDPATNTDFSLRVMTLTLNEPLPQTYQGSIPDRTNGAQANTSHIRTTIVSDAVKYHTVHQLAIDAPLDSLTIKLDSVYTQLVPSSTQDSSIVDTPPGGSIAVITSATAHQKIYIDDGALPKTAYTPTAITPGSVYMEFDNLAGGVRAVDDSAGNLRAGTTILGSIVGSINYSAGTITVASAFAGGLTLGAGSGYYYLPAAEVSKIAQTFQKPVSQSTRGYVYNATLHPIPAPGTLQFSYRSLARWYTLTDDGSGKLVGEDGTGSGSLNFATGTVSVSLGALPDIGSSNIYSWSASTEYEIKVADTNITTPAISGTLPAGNCKPTTFSVAWTAGGVGKTASDSGGTGVLTGDATGRVVYANGTFSILPTLLPDPTTQFAITYQASTIRTELFNPSKSGSTITITVAHGPIRPKSLLISYEILRSYHGVGGPSAPIQFTDDGSGGLMGPATFPLSGSVVDYTAGTISFDPDILAGQGFGFGATLEYDTFDNTVPARTADPTTGYYSGINTLSNWVVTANNVGESLTFVNATNVTVQYKEDSASDTAHTYTLNEPPLTIDLTPLTTNTVVPGGVMFTIAGRTYVDRAGSLYYGVASATNAGTLGGSVNYSTGLATLTSWVGGGSSALSINALLTQVGTLPITVLTGRAPGQRLQPASFYIQANKIDGTLISATADVDGNIATASIHGYIDVTTGVYSVAFGEYVLDSSLSVDDKAQPWYNASAISGGYILKPYPVTPNSITFNCVVQTSLPLDSAILGIDTVRLPPDGRVQAVRPADMLILFDIVVTALPGGLTASQVVTLPRGLLAQVDVRDQTGADVLGQLAGGPTVSGAKFTTDLAAGTITMANPLDLSAFTQPLVATHRIEDSCLVTDVQITGEVSIAQPLTHAYTAANSLASTALIAPFVGGSVQGKYTNLFSQQTWDSAHPNWTDAVIGNGTTAAFDDLDFPIQVLNRDAITEKWALVFTSSTAFNIVGQDVGIIGTGTTSGASSGPYAGYIAPLNPGTGFPYWVIDHRSFGIGWPTGAAIRFDTEGAGMPVWLARTIKSGPATYTDDRDVIEPRWDKS